MQNLLLHKNLFYLLPLVIPPGGLEDGLVEPGAFLKKGAQLLQRGVFPPPFNKKAAHPLAWEYAASFLAI